MVKKSETQEKKKISERMFQDGFHLQRFNFIMVIVSCILVFFLLLCVFRSMHSFQAMSAAVEEYMTCQRYAEDLSEGSDYLTQEAQLFAVTGDPSHVRKYFNEINTVRRRDKAVEALQTYTKKSEAHDYLKIALWYSDELAKWEFYSMKLAVLARGYDLSEYPEEVQNAKAPGDEMDSNGDDMEKQAQNIVFDSFYQECKERIDRNVSLCVENLVVSIRHEQSTNSTQLFRLLRWQEILACLLLVVVLVLILLTNRLAIRPLRQFVARIQEHDWLPVVGSYEVKYMAEAYNKVLTQTQLSHERLSYEAEHDQLTGVYNRGVFERIRDTFETEQVALILVDVDEFKGINDTYGHDVGDAILKRISGLLLETFRSEDFVCRIGGDEFAVVMIHMNSSLKEMVQQKIARVNNALQQPIEGIPKVTLSVGVAFSDRKNSSGDLYKDADAALYRVKRGGRNNCEFY